MPTLVTCLDVVVLQHNARIVPHSARKWLGSTEKSELKIVHTLEVLVEEDNLLSATPYTQRNLIERKQTRHRSFFRSANLGDDRVGAVFGLSALKDPRA